MSYSSEVLADSPAAYWQLQEASGNPQDSSGNGKHLTTVTGTPDYQQAGPFSGAFSIHLAAGEKLERLGDVATTVTDNWTLEGWVSFISAAANGRTAYANGTTAGYELDIDIDGTWHYTRDGGAGAGIDAVIVLNSTWRLLHIIRRAGVIEYWVNGVIDTNGAGGGVPSTPSGNIQVGAGSSLDVSVSHMAIYASALTQARIEAHYAAGSLSPPIPPITKPMRIGRW